MQAQAKPQRVKPLADLPREVYSIREFCQIVGQSRAEFYKQQSLGLGPLTIEMGRRKRGIAAKDLRAFVEAKRQAAEAQRLADTKSKNQP